MTTYIDTTRFAALQLFNVIASVQNDIADIQRHLKLGAVNQKQLDFLNQRVNAARDPKGCDPDKHAAMVSFLEERIREYRTFFVDTESRIKDFQKQFEYFNLSADCLRMAILQIAKQGISATYKSYKACPNGRMIGSQPLKTVIWQSRNQAIHHEESSYNPTVQQCFEILCNDFDDRFSLTKHGTENLAAPVFDVLEWIDYPHYEADMKTLLEPILLA